MLNYLKKENELTYTENGALTYNTTQFFCLDLFFRAGAMRNVSEREIADAVIRAYTENPLKTMKIVFFARDARGGLGERRFFRAAIRTLAQLDSGAVNRNIPLIAEYGRFDDLCTLIGTPCEKSAVEEIRRQLSEDIEAYKNSGKVSLLAKWLPSVNASSAETRASGRKIAKLMGMSEREYRHTLSELRRFTDIIENRLRVCDYTFDYEKQPSCAMMKYRKAFIRNDGIRYNEYLNAVNRGEAKLNASVLYPYDIVRRCLDGKLSAEERLSLDTTWKSLPEYGNSAENSIAVIDGSGSMTCGIGVRPIDAALSLGIYFAEHNKGRFANHFITFSEKPRLVEIKGRDIVEKVNFCNTFNEVANTDLEAVFDLVLRTAVKNKVSEDELPARLYIISDMEFDYCVEGGNNFTIFEAMKRKYARFGYRLPEVIFWNVSSRQSNMPVQRSETGAALVSGFTPALFDMVIGGEISPEIIMESIINSERYAKVS
ncbi:MAG: DUF2828 family protein [Ruminococcus sp.]|nr:DUF2828 family protein [Ruminococcus sp.]